MPFVIPTDPPKQTTGGGGFRVAGASLIEQPPKWKPDVLAAVAPQRKIDWMGERNLPVVGEFEHSGGHRADVISYPAPTEKDPNNRVLLVPPKVPQRPSKKDEWLYGKDGYDAWLAKNGHRYQPSIVEKDAKTGKYRVTGTYLPAAKRDTGETQTQAADVPEVEAFARNRETLELLKGRNPEKFASAMKDYENYLVAKQRSPLAAIPLGKKALEQFKELMPEGGYDRWVSERKQVERGDSNPPLALNKAGSDQKPTAFKPSETRGDYATNLGIPVESLLQDEDAAARKKFQESQVSDSAAGRFGQSFTTGVESVSSGLNRILNPFVSDETLDEVGRNRDSFRQVVQDKGGLVGDVLNKAADSTGAMAAGAAVGAVTGGTGTLMALAAGIAQYDDAYREATDAGLRGEQRTQYAMAQAGWEAGTSLVFTKALKIPGVEGAFARGAVGGKTFGEILKRVAVQSGVSGVEEIPEEVSTAIGQNLTAKLSGVDPERAVITPEELTDIITQSFVQSGMMTGARNAPDMARSLKPGQQQTAAGDQPAAAAAGAAGPTPQQGPPALPILAPPSAATADTTDFVPADLEGANNVNGLAQASPQVKWSNQIIQPQVLPAETNGNTAELPIARLAGETKGGGETPTPEPTKADPLRKLQALPTTSDQVAVWAIENPELVKRVAEATKDGQPLTRAFMDSLGLKRGNAEQRAAFVKALFPEQTQGATDASKTPSPAETQVLPPEQAAAPAPQAVTPPPKLSPWLQEAIDQGYEQAEKLGVADKIEELSAQRLTRAQIIKALPELANVKKLGGVDGGHDASTIVNAVRSKRNIPSMDDKGEFERWLKDRQAKLSQSKTPPPAEVPPPEQAAAPAPQAVNGQTTPNTPETPDSSTTTATAPKGKRPAAPKRPAEPPQPVPRTARLALSNYTIRNRYHDKKRAALRDADAEYQRLKAAADAERRAESAQQATMTKREKEAERAQAQQEIAAGNVNRDNVKYALLHEVEPELMDRIQTEAQRLLGETDSDDTANSLKKIIKDAGADVGAGVEKQKERIVKILTGELDQRNGWTKNTEAPRPPDPIVQLLLAPQADRGTTIAAAQRSVADGNPDALAVYAREQVESELNKDTTLDDPYVAASEDQILDKLGEVADLVGATMPEGDTGFDFGGEQPAEPGDGFELKRESAGATGPQKFDNAEGEQRRMFSGMDALPGQEDLFDGLDKPAEAGQGFQSQDSAEAPRKGPNPFRKNTRESSEKAAASTETSAGQSARRPNPFGKVPRATRSNASEASAEPSKRPDGSNARPYGGGLEASAAGKLGPRVLKPLPMPELIHLARELLGKLPQIRKRMGAAFGRFQYKPGTRFMDIFIRADVPQNEQDVAETLAHEIGHLIDYLPDLEMGRGNILGRIASLRKYLKDYMAGKEGGPGPLTADDEKRLRAEAKKLMSTTAETEIDEEIRQTMPITPADVLAVWNALDTSKLSPDLITYIKRASAAEKKSIIRQAAKGIVADQLKQFATEVVTKTGKKIKQTTTKAASAAEIKAKLEELVAEEIRKRELLSRKTITEELIAVSEWWRPYDKQKAPADFKKYRESSVELYADALSVLLNSPGDLQAMAPEFWRGFMEYIDKKPEFLNAFLELQSILAGDDATVAARRRENIQAMFGRGDDATWASLNAARAAMRSVMETVHQFLGSYLLNKNIPINQRAAKVRKSGVNVDQAENIVYVMDELSRIDNVNHLFMSDVDAKVWKPALDSGMSRDDLGEYLFLKRVIAKRMVDGKERYEIANPLGFNSTESKKQMNDLARKLGPEKFAVLEKSANAFYDLVFAAAENAMKAGYYSKKHFDEVIKPSRDSYAAFAVVKYLQDYVSPAIHQQVGTFEEIANPFDATVMKILALNRMVELNKAKSSLRDFLASNFKDEIVATPIAYKQREPSKPAPKGSEYIYVYEDGKAKAYAVPTEIARSFKSHDIGGLIHYANVFSSFQYQIFHPAYVTLSPGFNVANPFKDLRRTVRNVPGAAKLFGGRITVRDILSHYFNSTTAGIAWRRARGISDDTIRRMMETRALDTPFHEIDAESRNKGQFQRLAEKHGSMRAEAATSVGRAWQTAKSLIEIPGVFLESMSKVATFRAGEKAGIRPDRLAYMINKYAGTPDYKQRGLATPITNFIWMYSKVMVNGLAADLSLATNPKTAAGWWWRTFAFDLVPIWTYRGVLYGYLPWIGGQSLAEFFQHVPKYHLDAFDILPIGYSAPGDDDEPGEGKATYFAIPRDETGKIIAAVAGSIFDFVAELNGEDTKSGSAGKAASEAARSIQAGATPNFSPLLNIGLKWLQFAADQNPTDFRGKPIIPRDNWDAGGWDATKMMLSWTSDQFGAYSDLANWAGKDNILPSRFRGASGDRKNDPWYARVPGLSRLIHVSNYGIREDEWIELDSEAKADAKFRLSLPDATKRLVSERYALSKADTLGNLDDKRSLKLFYMNSFYAHSYLPLTQEIRKLEDEGKDASELRKELERNTEIANAKAPPQSDKESRAEYLKVHGQAIGTALMEATSPTPEREKREKSDVFAKRQERYVERTNGAARLVKLLDLTAEEKQQLLKDEAKRRGNGTKRWEGEYNNRRTDFGRREAKLKTLSP